MYCFYISENPFMYVNIRNMFDIRNRKIKNFLECGIILLSGNDFIVEKTTCYWSKKWISRDIHFFNKI